VSRQLTSRVHLRAIRDVLLGQPVRSEETASRTIGPLAAVPYLGLDALASAAYGPEAALTVLMPLGAAGLAHAGTLMLFVVGLLLIVQASYRQTIAAYPDGGGAYTVSRQNLGVGPALVAASALFLDYVLNAAVAISAGVGALVSAVPALLPYTLLLCLGILTLITVVNLRGARDTGVAFMAPTYLFAACLGGVCALGLGKLAMGHGQVTAVVAPPPLHPAAVELGGLWLLARAFASGCTAMTGVEAVSNSVPVFREPRARNGQRTLTAIVAILVALLLGIAVLCPAYQVGATEPGHAGYESVLSQLTGAVVGRGPFYYLTMGAVVAVLCLSANTSFAAFPGLCRLLARDGFLPAGMAHRGPRLTYSSGILLLALLTGILLVVFGGITDRLIPLFAVGAFLAFTMSQVGMVAHWRRQPERRVVPLLMNAVGATATAATLVVIVASKLTQGAWISLLLLGLLLLVFNRVHRALDRLESTVRCAAPLNLSRLQSPLVVVPLKRLDRVARKALRFALTLSQEVMAVQLLAENCDEEDLSGDWEQRVESPCREAGLPAPKLVVLRSPYREVLEPLLRHVERLAVIHPQRPLAVIVPELVERRWYHFFLHSHTGTLLKVLLVRRGGPRIVVISAPWYADDEGEGENEGESEGEEGTAGDRQGERRWADRRQPLKKS
jgi:amino acid transporter